MHEVLHHMGQFISRDSDVIKSRISKTTPIHKKATVLQELFGGSTQNGQCYLQN